MPGVNGLGVVAGGVQNAENAECTDCVTMASIAERWTRLKPVSCWELGTIGMSGSGLDSIEDKEALSNRALSSCSCLRLDGTFRCVEGLQLRQMVATRWRSFSLSAHAELWAETDVFVAFAVVQPRYPA